MNKLGIESVIRKLRTPKFNVNLDEETTVVILRRLHVFLSRLLNHDCLWHRLLLIIYRRRKRLPFAIVAVVGGERLPIVFAVRGRIGSVTLRRMMMMTNSHRLNLSESEHNIDRVLRSDSPKNSYSFVAVRRLSVTVGDPFLLTLIRNERPVGEPSRGVAVGLMKFL
uniref:Uncharacterized protein n=1 Tax=Romanomermis culicivorax TaxID=13658 RepID=A0A915HW54_ROMCU